MRGRGIEIVGGLAVAGVVLLVALSLWPQSEEPTTVVVPSSGDSVLGTQVPSPEASPTAAETPDATPTDEPEETPTPQPDDEPADEALPEDARGEVRVLVLNAGAPDGAAGLITGALAEQGFDPADPDNAAAPSDSTRVLYASNQRGAALAVGTIVGADADDVAEANSDDPNWTAFGSDLDVLVVVGPPLP